MTLRKQVYIKNFFFIIVIFFVNIFKKIKCLFEIKYEFELNIKNIKG